MALVKAKVAGSGHLSEYWRITELIVNYAARRSNVEVSLYKDEPARRAGGTVVEAPRYSWDGADFPFDAANVEEAGKSERQVAYAFLKRSIPIQVQIGTEEIIVDGVPIQQAIYETRESNFFFGAVDA